MDLNDDFLADFWFRHIGDHNTERCMYIWSHYHYTTEQGQTQVSRNSRKKRPFAFTGLIPPGRENDAK